MKPTPAGWPRISTAIYYDDPAAAIDWLCAAFGFNVRFKVEGEGGRIVHSQLEFGEGLIMVSDAKRDGHDGPPMPSVSPREIEGRVTQAMCLVVDDVDAHYAHAKAAGARIESVPQTTDHGPDYWADRTYRAVDPEGHQWWFMQRVRG